MEDLLNEVEEVTKTGTWKLNLKTNSLYWSHQSYKLHYLDDSYPITMDKVLGLYTKESQIILNKALTDLKEKCEGFSINLKIKNSNNQIKHIHVTGKAVIENDKVSTIYGTFRDIENELLLQQTNHTLSQQFGDLSQSIDQFFICADTDKNGIITSINQNFINISGYSERELIGQNHRILNSGEHSKEFFETLWKRILSGKSWEGQICNRKKDGSLYWVHTFIFPIIKDQQTISGFKSIRYDITEKVQFEIKLQKERENIAFSSQLAAVGEMSAGIAHEIANPLSIILGQSELLSINGENPDSRRLSIEKIQKATYRISKITKGLHRLAQGTRSDEYRTIQLDHIINETLDFCGEILKSKQIELKLTGDSGDIKLHCNEVKISQILLNLINNAKDAIAEHNPEQKVIEVIIEELDQSKFHIHVTNTGPLIEKDIREKIMTSFFTTKPLGKGTGLGLTLASRFAKEHDGRVFLNDDFDQTCFTIELNKA